MNTYYCATQINRKTLDVTLNKKNLQNQVIDFPEREIFFDTINLATVVNFFRILISQFLRKLGRSYNGRIWKNQLQSAIYLSIQWIQNGIIRPLKKTTYNVKMLANYFFSFEYMIKFSHNKVSSTSITYFTSYSTFPEPFSAESTIMPKQQIYAIFEPKILKIFFYFVILSIFDTCFSDKGMYCTHFLAFRFNLIFIFKKI